jgi:uncharacterized membrane protein YphA (DoxX/SURF4 family)
MSSARTSTPLTILQWALGVVILIEAILFVMPSARHGFAQTHMPDGLRFILGWGEIAGCVLLLIPRTAVRGAWILAVVFSLAILIHLRHGMYNIGDLVVYIAAAAAIGIGKEQ